MLAARDQENLVHARQTAAAAKPQNQGVRALPPKTPAAVKTPFRPAKNNENKPFGFNGQKTQGKGIEVKTNQNAFVTPLGPRTRAPLGAKTTNAKAGAFKTPAPPQQTVKAQKTLQRLSTGRRSAKSKIVIPPSQTVEADVLSREDDDDVPEIEYAPPPPVELPDLPTDLDYEHMPQFDALELVRAWEEELRSPKDEHGVSLRVKQEQEAEKRYQERTTREILKVLDDMPDPFEADRQVQAMIAAGPKRKPSEAKVGTVNAKAAASALSRPRPISNALQPTASSLQKQKATPASRPGSKGAPRPATTSLMQNAAAVAVSKNTIGFPKAAKPRSIVPKQEPGSAQPSTPAQLMSQLNMDPETFVELYGEPPVDSEMWYRLLEKRSRPRNDREDDDRDPLAGELLDTDFFHSHDDEGDEVFQLPMPD